MQKKAIGLLFVAMLVIGGTAIFVSEWRYRDLSAQVTALQAKVTSLEIATSNSPLRSPTRSGSPFDSLQGLFEDVPSIQIQTTPQTTYVTGSQIQTMQFASSTIIDGDKFDYTISITGGTLHGTIGSTNPKALTNFKTKLADMSVTFLASTDTSLEFEATGKALDDVLVLLGITR